MILLNSNCDKHEEPVRFRKMRKSSISQQPGLFLIFKPNAIARGENVASVNHFYDAPLLLALSFPLTLIME